LHWWVNGTTGQFKRKANLAASNDDAVVLWLEMEGCQMTKDEIKTHNAAVEAMFQQIKPIVESYDSSVVLNTLLITLAACGQQTDLEPEVFKAAVVLELDRLMLINAERKGMLS
jgi:hypothetical protein